MLPYFRLDLSQIMASRIVHRAVPEKVEPERSKTHLSPESQSRTQMSDWVGREHQRNDLLYPAKIKEEGKDTPIRKSARGVKM